MMRLRCRTAKAWMRTRRTCVRAVAVMVTALLVACSQSAPDGVPVGTDASPVVEVCVDENDGAQMTYDEAAIIAAESSCVEHGELADDHTCNGATGTWWIEMDVDVEGCSAACTVNIVDKVAEINWRCTGALPETTDTAAASAEPPPTDAPTGTPDPAENWPKYASQSDGFSFRYPPTWTIELLTDQDAPGDVPPARAVLLSQETLRLRIAFKTRDEGAAIGPEAMPDGRTEQRGTVTVFGRRLPRMVVVDEGSDRAVFAGDRFADLEIYTELVMDDGTEDADAGIPEWALADFDAILSTLRRTDPEASQDAYPGWATYISEDAAPGLGFTFRHRSDWTRTDVASGTATEAGPAAAMVLLERDGHLLRVQYKRPEDETVMVPPDADASLLTEAGTAWFMGRPMPRLIIADEERLTHILVSYSDDALLISVELTQNPTLVPEDERDLSAGIRGELDEILASFKLTSP